MTRPPSEKTQLATARRELRDTERQLNTVKIELAHYRGRATKAEQELSEWKARFDQLLKLSVERAGEGA